MQKVVVIGMGMSLQDMTRTQLEWVHAADILVGGRRHLEAFDDLDVEKRVITGKVAETIAYVREHMTDRRIVVLASGDPLFFGIGALITKALGPDRVNIVPNISSVAAAFARIGEPWSEARVISLHGRDRRYDLLAALKDPGPVGVLTDARQTPEWLAGWLMEKKVEGWRMAVFEQLGAPEEQFGWYDLDQAGSKYFEKPNVVILKRDLEADPSEEALHLGMADDAFAHESGLITKSEVRAVTLAKLRLAPGLTLWDLGAGSGSVGIEAAVLLGNGRIVAVEQHADRVEQIRQNVRRFGIYNHEVVRARLPDGLDDLPRPDRIFIGGGGGDLAVIIKHAALLLDPGGTMVINTVLMENLNTAVKAMEENGMTVEVVQVQVNKSKAMPWSMRFEAQNPVWVITGER